MVGRETLCWGGGCRRWRYSLDVAGMEVAEEAGGLQIVCALAWAMEGGLRTRRTEDAGGGRCVDVVEKVKMLVG